MVLSLGILENEKAGKFPFFRGRRKSLHHRLRAKSGWNGVQLVSFPFPYRHTVTEPILFGGGLITAFVVFATLFPFAAWGPTIQMQIMDRGRFPFLAVSLTDGLGLTCCCFLTSYEVRSFFFLTHLLFFPLPFVSIYPFYFPSPIFFSFSAHLLPLSIFPLVSVPSIPSYFTPDGFGIWLFFFSCRSTWGGGPLFSSPGLTGRGKVVDRNNFLLDTTSYLSTTYLLTLR